MKFKNKTSDTVRFVLNTFPFEVTPGEVCDIPDRYAYTVASRGLPLTAMGKLPTVALPKPAKKERREVEINSGPTGNVVDFGEELSQIPLESEG